MYFIWAFQLIAIICWENTILSHLWLFLLPLLLFLLLMQFSLPTFAFLRFNQVNLVSTSFATSWAFPGMVPVEMYFLELLKEAPFC